MLYLLIALGGALGSVARFWLGNLIAEQVHSGFPWGTLVVNITGSFAIGFFATLTLPDGRWPAHNHTRHFFMTGLCGGYTTFSAFSLQTLQLAREGAWLRVSSYTAASVLACVAAAAAGHLCASALNRQRGL